MASEIGVAVTMEPRQLGEFLRWKPIYPTPFISGGILYPRNRLMLYGRYKALKSMMFLALGRALACGQSWMGFDTPKEGIRVLYLQLEIPELLLHKRMARMELGWSATGSKRMGEMLRENFYVWTEPYMKLDHEPGIAALRQRIEAIRPAAILIDPVYKIISGNILDPNHIRQFCDNIDVLLGDYELSVLLAHHARKSAISEDSSYDLGSDDMLGAAVFSYWADTVIKIAKTGEKNNQIGLQLNFDVIRHAEEEIEPKAIVFDREDLMFREGGQLVSIAR